MSGHEPARVTDDWSGGPDAVADLFCENYVTGRRGDLTPEHHEHGHHDGALYCHAHPGGDREHDHVYDCDGRCERNPLYAKPVETVVYQ